MAETTLIQPKSSRTRLFASSAPRAVAVKQPKKDPLGLVGLRPAFDLLSLALWTGQVAGERPLSMILVAPPASGKTELLQSLECEVACFKSDLTSRDISSVLHASPKITHILLGDLLTLFGHRSHVVQLACRSLSVLTGETMRTDTFTGENVNRMLGLISAIPPDDLGKFRIKSQLEAGGLATRFVFARYRYTDTTVKEIHEYIKSDLYTTEAPYRINVTAGAGPVPVHISKAIADRLADLSVMLRKPNDSIGTRPHHHLRVLCKASALSEGRAKVTTSDVDRVLSHAPFFTSEGKEL